MNRKLWLYFSLALILILASPLGCQKSEQAKSSVPVAKLDGGADSGGGNTSHSEIADVDAAVDFAKRLLTTSDLRRNILVRFAVFAQPVGSKDTFNLQRLFPQMPFRPQFVKAEDIPKVISSPVMETFAKAQIDKKRDNTPCKAADNDHADASVSSKDLNGRVCVSLGLLSRTAPEALLGQVLALMVHEMAHLGGAEEAEARQWQEKFAFFFSVEFGSAHNAFMTEIWNAQLRITDRLGYAAEFLKQSPSDPRFFAILGAVYEKMKVLPHFSDPLFLEIALRPKHPEWIENFQNAHRAAIEELATLLPPDPQDAPSPVSALPPQTEWKAQLDRVHSIAAVAESNFFAFVYGSKPTKCVLPKKINDRPALEFSGSFFFNLSPETKCD